MQNFDKRNLENPVKLSQFIKLIAKYFKHNKESIYAYPNLLKCIKDIVSNNMPQFINSQK